MINFYKITNNSNKRKCIDICKKYLSLLKGEDIDTYRYKFDHHMLSLEEKLSIKNNLKSEYKEESFESILSNNNSMAISSTRIIISSKFKEYRAIDFNYTEEDDTMFTLFMIPDNSDNEYIMSTMINIIFDLIMSDIDTSGDLAHLYDFMIIRFIIDVINQCIILTKEDYKYFNTNTLRFCIENSSNSIIETINNYIKMVFDIVVFDNNSNIEFEKFILTYLSED